MFLQSFTLPGMIANGPSGCGERGAFGAPGPAILAMCN